MDAKDAWKRLEPRVEEFERKAEMVTEEIEQMGRTLKSGLLKLRDRMSQGPKKTK